jgi:hypothetical protein
MLQFENIYSGVCEEYCRLIFRNKGGGWSSWHVGEFSTRLHGFASSNTVLFKIKWTLKRLVYNASVLNLSRSMFLETKSAEKQTWHWNKRDSYKGKMFGSLSFLLWIGFTVYYKLWLQRIIPLQTTWFLLFLSPLFDDNSSGEKACIVLLCIQHWHL